MSYVRWNKDSDVYCYENRSDLFFVHVTNGETFRESSEDAMVNRLRKLRDEGYLVPEYLFEKPLYG